MKEKIENLIKEAAQLYADNKEQLEELRIKFLGRKGVLQDMFQDFKTVPNEEKRDVGMLMNQLKDKIQERLDALKELLEDNNIKSNKTNDLTLPVRFNELGSRHPLSLVRSQICDIFSNIGFTVAEGPEIEDDWHLFSALNFAPDHPARDMQDTFFLQKEPDIALRTHTSSVQIRMMEHTKPPIRMIFPGRVYRNEAISARAHCLFHQVEGLYIDQNVSFADLKQSLLYFTKAMFGSETKIRLRPSYFPFTEPSAEMDISCNICGGVGCNICKGSGWVEILGCGMVDPNVLQNCGIDPNIYSGFAFGMGIERITMLKYGINDIRLFFENDIRFLKQFEGTL